MIISILVDLSRSIALRRIAKETKSQALEADVLHFTFNIPSSAVVLAELGLPGWMPWQASQSRCSGEIFAPERFKPYIA